MKRILSLLALCALAVTSAAQGGQELAPIPDAHMQEGIVLEHEAFVDQASMAVPLYTNVKYKDLDEMSCCAQPKIIAVKDPCACEDDCCAPQCVYIQICVPTCGCELVSCRRNGDRIRYDYGQYAVDVRVRRNHIEVDYQD